MTENFDIFTDGSALSNSTVSPAGYAVYFPKLCRLFSKSMYGTNNQAELKAIQFALWFLDKNYKEIVDKLTPKVVVYSDSMYCVKIMSKINTPKKNLEIIEKCFDLIEQLQQKGIHIEFIHVRAHTNMTDYLSKNNDIVDKAARKKAMEAANRK